MKVEAFWVLFRFSYTPVLMDWGKIVLGFYFLWGDVAQCLIKKLGVPPMTPSQGGKLGFPD